MADIISSLLGRKQGTPEVSTTTQTAGLDPYYLDIAKQAREIGTAPLPMDIFGERKPPGQAYHGVQHLAESLLRKTARNAPTNPYSNVNQIKRLIEQSQKRISSADITNNLRGYAEDVARPLMESAEALHAPLWEKFLQRFSVGQPASLHPKTGAGSEWYEQLKKDFANMKQVEKNLALAHGWDIAAQHMNPEKLRKLFTAELLAKTMAAREQSNIKKMDTLASMEQARREEEEGKREYELRRRLYPITEQMEMTNFYNQILQGLPITRILHTGPGAGVGPTRLGMPSAFRPINIPPAAAPSVSSRVPRAYTPSLSSRAGTIFQQRPSSLATGREVSPFILRPTSQAPLKSEEDLLREMEQRQREILDLESSSASSRASPPAARAAAASTPVPQSRSAYEALLRKMQEREQKALESDFSSESGTPSPIPHRAAPASPVRPSVPLSPVMPTSMPAVSTRVPGLGTALRDVESLTRPGVTGRPVLSYAPSTVPSPHIPPSEVPEVPYVAPEPRRAIRSTILDTLRGRPMPPSTSVVGEELPPISRAPAFEPGRIPTPDISGMDISEVFAVPDKKIMTREGKADFSVDQLGRIEALERAKFKTIQKLSSDERSRLAARQNIDLSHKDEESNKKAREILLDYAISASAHTGIPAVDVPIPSDLYKQVKDMVSHAHSASLAQSTYGLHSKYGLYDKKEDILSLLDDWRQKGTTPAELLLNNHIFKELKDDMDRRGVTNTISGYLAKANKMYIERAGNVRDARYDSPSLETPLSLEKSLKNLGGDISIFSHGRLLKELQNRERELTEHSSASALLPPNPERRHVRIVEPSRTLVPRAPGSPERYAARLAAAFGPPPEYYEAAGPMPAPAPASSGPSIFSLPPHQRPA